MKLAIFLITLTSLAVSASAQGLTTLTKVSPIRMEVRQNTKNKSVVKATEAHTQERSLTIILQNNSNESFDGLVVKYWFFTRDPKGRNPAVLKQGEKTASLGPRSRDACETETVSSTYTREHTELERVNGQANNPQGNVAVKKVPASGRKIAGYAVKLYSAGSVVAEYYSEPGFKPMTGAN